MITITSNFDSDATVVNWQLGKFCEKNCHYCTAYDFKLSIKKGKNVLFYPDDRLAFDDHIADLLPKVIKKGHILFFGGEPTLHPKGIEYFNQICKETKDNPDVVVFLVTHGDIDLEKIQAINPHGKKEHIISISYHYYQVVFEEWFEKVKLWNTRGNIIVSSIVPRRPKVWDQYRKNMRIVLDSGISTELKPELDNRTNMPDPVSMAEFKDMFYEASGKQPPWLGEKFGKEVYLDDGTRKETIRDIEVLGNIPLCPNKTMCSIRQYCISDNILSYSCDEGDRHELSIDTTQEELDKLLQTGHVMCTKESCTENRQLPATIRIMSTDLDDPVYKKYIGTKL